MSMPEPNPIRRLDQNQRRSRAVAFDRFVFLAGQVADDTSLDIDGQARQALAKVDALLALAGTSKARVLTAQVWLASMADYDGFNAVWDDWVAPGDAPTRSCGEVKLADPDCRVEIIVTAARP